MAGIDKSTPQPTEIKLDGLRQHDMWQHYLRRLAESGASRDKK